MKKILVTGGAGYIGSICVEELINRGVEVSVFDNLTEGHAKAVDSRADLFQGDLADRTVLRHAFGEVKPDAVMHFAANALARAAGSSDMIAEKFEQIQFHSIQ